MADSKECVICKTGVRSEPTRRKTRWSREVTPRGENEGLTFLFKLLLKTSRNKEFPLLKKEQDESPENCVIQAVEQLKDTNYAVCLECSNVASTALEVKLRVEVEERKVIDLQKQLLEAVRALQSQMDNFHGEMSKIGDSIRASESDNIPEPKTETPKNPGEKEAVIIREELLDVLTDLRICKTQIEDRLVLFRLDEQSVTEAVPCEADVDCDFENETDSFLETEMYTEEMENMEERDPPQDEDASKDTSVIEEDEEDEIEHSLMNSPLVGHCIGIVENRRQENTPKLTCNLCGHSCYSQFQLASHTKRFHPEETSTKNVSSSRLSDAHIAEKMLSKAMGIMSAYISRESASKSRTSEVSKQPEPIKKPSQPTSEHKVNVVKKKRGKKIVPTVDKKKKRKPRQKMPKFVPIPDKVSDKSGEKVNVVSEPLPPSTSHALSEEKDTKIQPENETQQEDAGNEKKPRRSTRGMCVLNIKELLDMPIADEAKRRRKHSLAKETVKKED